MCELIFSLQEFLKIVPGIAIFPLSFYLAWKKIGSSIGAYVSVTSNRISAKRIGDVILTNYKDKPVCIYEIEGLLDGISFEIDKFDPPIILKALESIKIETKPFSLLMLNGNKWEPNFISGGQLQIYLLTSKNKIKCKNFSKPSRIKPSEYDFKKYAQKTTNSINGVAYNENAIYAITYKDDSTVKTALVDTSGFINGNWNFHFNKVPSEALVNEATLHQCLVDAELSKLTKGFTVGKLHQL